MEGGGVSLLVVEEGVEGVEGVRECFFFPWDDGRGMGKQR